MTLAERLAYQRVAAYGAAAQRSERIETLQARKRVALVTGRTGRL